MKIAIIGRGRVGSALEPVFVKAGHEVVFGVRDPGDPKHAGSEVGTMSTAQAAAWGDVIIAAIMWDAIDTFLEAADDMTGKILIDCINPYDFAGGLRRTLDAGTSTAMLIQERTSAAVVKTLNQVGSPVMADPAAYDLPPLQFVASDNEEAKVTVCDLLRDIGFDVRDAGGLDYAVELEGMARLWIAQTFMHGMNAETSWALVERK